MRERNGQTLNRARRSRGSRQRSLSSQADLAASVMAHFVSNLDFDTKIIGVKND